MSKQTAPSGAVGRAWAYRGMASHICASAPFGQLGSTRVPAAADPRTGDVQGAYSWSPPA